MQSIIVEPVGRTVPLKKATSLLDLLRGEGIQIPSACGGRLKCGRCLVIVEDSTLPLPPPEIEETKILGELFQSRYRLACCLFFDGPAKIRIPQLKESHSDVIITASAGLRKTSSMPPVRACTVKIAGPCEAEDGGEATRLFHAIGTHCGITPRSCDITAFRSLSELLKKGEKEITSIVRHKREVITVCCGNRKSLLGAAFDIGTTTVVGYLIDLDKGKEISVSSSINPQIRYGYDVIGRISYAKTVDDGIEILKNLILDCMNSLVSKMSLEAGIDTSEIYEATVVGNTAMHHFLLGLNPWSLSIAPYNPVFCDAVDFKARDIGLHIAPSAYVHFLPLKAGFVGSDAVAGAIATGINRRKNPCLLIDIGTNGEIIFGDKKGLICCSTAAGPAFEGGHIVCGMRACAGAIDRVSINPETLDVSVKTIGNEPPGGICGSGVISATAEMLRAGIITGGGRFSEKLRSGRIREGDDGREFVLVYAHESAIGKDIIFTHRDISEVQMAKAAIQAGTSVIRNLADLPEPARIFLAGAGGNAIDPEDAEALGLIPSGGSSKAFPVGNAAGKGACLALLNTSVRKEAAGLARKMRYVELSGLPLFQEMFISCLPFDAGEGGEDYR